MIVIEKEVFRLHLPTDEKKNLSGFRVVLAKEMQGGKRLETTERLLYLFILPRNEGLPQKIQTNTHIRSLQKED